MKINTEILFMPLGGAQSIGTSCYFLRIGNENIILDAGSKRDGKITIFPRTNYLTDSALLKSMNEINRIFISHAHMDHIGFLPLLKENTPMSTVYMTELTREFSDLQLVDRYPKLDGRGKILKKGALDVLNKAITVSYLEKITFPTYSVTFYPAGHIPGAIMMLFEAGGRKILYTGDYSLNTTALTGGCIIPEDKNIDTIILCALHANHSEYSNKKSSLEKLVKRIYETATFHNRTAYCRTNQLSKGIEVLKALNKLNEYSDVKIDIYLDYTAFEAIKRIEKVGVPILTEHNHYLGSNRIKPGFNVILASNDIYYRNCYEFFKTDISLHEDFEEMETFIRLINPKSVYLVHCGEKRKLASESIDQRLLHNPYCKTQFVYAEENELYKL